MKKGNNIINYGSIEQVATGNKSKQYINTYNSKNENLGAELKQTSWYDKWWVISIIAAIIVGILAWFLFKSVLVTVTTVIVVAIMVYLLNPKRRFLSAALAILGVIGLGSSSSVSGKFDYKKSLADGDLNLVFEFGEPMSTSLSVLLILLAAWLFWLDYNQ